MSNLITTQINELATRLDLPQSEELYNVLKATAFKGDVSDAQLSALLIVAAQYKLNPWTKEIYAFPDKGGIVPVVGVDGWSRIINSNSQFDGMEFDQDEFSCTCTIYRKDREHPTKLTEWMEECRRPGVKPWESHPRRMLRHKAMIQCARIAFGFGGIYDADEAERIIENQAPVMKSINPETGEITAKALPIYSDEDFTKNLPAWRKLIESGRRTVGEIIFTVSSRAQLTEEQTDILNATAITTIDTE
jgi:phage recombination protein Bet